MSLNINANYIGRPSGFSTAAEAVFALMDSDPPVFLKPIMATFIDSQVASGNWAVLLQFILYGMDTAANSVINWMSAGFNAVNAGSPHVPWSGAAHSGFAGFSPDGATLYVNSGIAPDDIGRDDFRTGLWIFTNDDSSANILFGSRDAGSTDDIFVQQGPGSNTIGIRVQASTSLSFAEVDGIFDDHSLYEAVRPDSTNQAFWKNGVQLDTEVRASEAVGTRNMYDGAWNQQGTAALELDCNITARLSVPNTGFNSPNFYSNLLIMLQSMGIEA